MESRKQTWQELASSNDRNAVRQGVRMAKRQASIDILDIPVPAAEK